MKIRIYHERKDEAIVLEVPDGECEIMVENDYGEKRDGDPAGVLPAGVDFQG